MAVIALWAVVMGAWLAPQRDALAIEREVERLAASRSFWPGYDPLAIPLAIYDGERTFLFRHPSPPEGFTPLAGSVPAAHVHDGRHPGVTANSSADIGGVVTATLLADGPRAALGARELAAVAIHEAFHVFQRKRHPGWQANEGDLLLYPTDDAKLLARRRLETDALRRALAGAGSEGACWARRAIAIRAERFAAMDSAFVTYERLTELNEGLATYVQPIAAGTTVAFPAAGFAAGEVRLRAYTVGPALALLLDRFAAGWQEGLEANDRRSLDELLRVGLERWTGSAATCAFSATETAAVERAAGADAAAVVRGRAERRRAFDARDEWKLIIQAPAAAPLWPQAFDPLNVERVEGGLIHSRFLRLGNELGTMTAIDEAGADIEVLTEAAGQHPLFNGVRRAVVAVPVEPAVQQDTVTGTVLVRTNGITAEFRNAAVRRLGRQIIVGLGAGSGR